MILEIVLGLVTAVLCLSVYYNYRFARIILKFEDRIEEALDDLDRRHRTIAEVLTKPVFFDSIEVRQVMAEINAARQTILKIANGLARVESENELPPG